MRGTDTSRVEARADAYSREAMVAGMVAALATIVLLVSLGMSTPALDRLVHGGGMDSLTAVSLNLNLALILLAWGRHRAARQAMRAHRAAEERAQLLGTRDVETELLNRQSLRDRGNQLIHEADARGGNVALIVIDVVRFTRVNEVHGHATGDALLRVIAGTILAAIPEGALCGRLGGDDFAVALAFDDGAEDDVTALAETLLSRIALPVEVAGSVLQVGAWIGIARLDDDCIDFSALLRRADIALRAAASAGGDSPLWFEASMEQAVRARSEIEAGLRRGIPLGEFVPYYQPIVEFGTSRIRGFEMLARWHHPTGGVIGPDTFIPVAEEEGLIGPLSEALMRQAFCEAREWEAGLTLAINLSPRQLVDPWLAERILKLLTETGLAPGRIELEITESSLFENMEMAQALVASLKNQGIRIALDDFGTGYSSLLHLRALPFDRIKVDRSFVQNCIRDHESWRIIQAIAALGQSLQVPITAEGVESGAIAIRMEQVGCDLGQGWFFGKPVVHAEVLRLLAEEQKLARSASSDRDSPGQAAA